MSESSDIIEDLLSSEYIAPLDEDVDPEDEDEDECNTQEVSDNINILNMALTNIEESCLSKFDELAEYQSQFAKSQNTVKTYRG